VCVRVCVCACVCVCAHCPETQRNGLSLAQSIVESPEGSSEIWFREAFRRWCALRFRIRLVSLYKILFRFKALLTESIILLLLPPTCEAYPIAILLHDHRAIYALPPTLLLYTIHHTILVKAISCKGQLLRVQSSPGVNPEPRFGPILDSRDGSSPSMQPLIFWPHAGAFGAGRFLSSALSFCGVSCMIRRIHQGYVRDVFPTVISALGYLSGWGNIEFYYGVQSLPGDHPKPPSGPILDPTVKS